MEVKKADNDSRLKRKRVVDKTKTGDRSVKFGDKVIVKQNKSTVKPPFELAPYNVVIVSGNNATLERGNGTLKVSFNKMKVIKTKAIREGEKGCLRKLTRGFS